MTDAYSYGTHRGKGGECYRTSMGGNVPGLIVLFFATSQTPRLIEAKCRLLFEASAETSQALLTSGCACDRV